MKIEIHEVNPLEGLQFKECCKLLLVTTDTKERDQVLEDMKPLNGHPYLYRVSKDNETYYIGAYGAYGAVLVNSRKGRIKVSTTVITTIDLWKPNAIIMLGTAFGIDREAQQIGDVLIAEQIVPYDSIILERFRSVSQSEQPASSPILQDRFNNFRGWSFPLNNKQIAKSFLCPILSGAIEFRDEKKRDDLIDKFPRVKGGDIDAHELYVAAAEKRTDWIVIKGISNFADHKKEHLDIANVKLATKSASNLAKSVFMSEYAFEDYKLILSKNCGIEVPSSAPPPHRNRVVNKKGRIGYRDMKNTQIIPYHYIEGQAFSEGLANVKAPFTDEERLQFIEEKRSKGHSLEEIRKKLKGLGNWGYIDTNGAITIPFAFEKANQFRKGRAWVVKNGKSFYINKKGEEIEKNE